MSSITFPPGLQVLERGWLSSNNILVVGDDQTMLIDSGYCTHSAQTLALVESALAGRPLDLLLNTHLHSDHCGGNAALQARYPRLHTRIPGGHAAEVARWDEAALTYAATGQQCPRFSFQELLLPGQEIVVGNWHWQVHAAAGHDPHSIILFEPEYGVLVSADALWEDGFGVVFPELEGISAFAEVGATLDLIASLKPELVIPGHGRPFKLWDRALSTARNRLAYFIQHPAKHQLYAAKVLLKFKLLELQVCQLDSLLTWASGTPYLERLRQEQHAQLSMREMVLLLLADLTRSGAAQREGDWVKNGK